MNKTFWTLLLVIALFAAEHIFPTQTGVVSYPRSRITKTNEQAVKGVITSAPFLDPARALLRTRAGSFCSIKEYNNEERTPHYKPIV